MHLASNKFSNSNYIIEYLVLSASYRIFFKEINYYLLLIIIYSNCCWSLNVMSCFLKLCNMSRNLDDVNIWDLLSSIVIYGILNFKDYILFSFFLVCRLFGSGMQNIHLMSDILDIFTVLYWRLFNSGIP